MRRSKRGAMRRMALAGLIALGAAGTALAGGNHVGGVVGYALATVSVTNCYNSATVIGRSFSRTGEMLFKPFSLKKWLRLLLIAFIAGAFSYSGLGQGGGGSKSSTPAASSASGGSAGGSLSGSSAGKDEALITPMMKVSTAAGTRPT